VIESGTKEKRFTIWDLRLAASRGNPMIGEFLPCELATPRTGFCEETFAMMYLPSRMVWDEIAGRGSQSGVYLHSGTRRGGGTARAQNDVTSLCLHQTGA
jgi:hypothetical protein